MLVRRARREDVAAIVKMTREAWKRFTVAEFLECRHGEVGERPWYHYKAGEIESFCDGSLERVLVAEERSEVIGYATWDLNHEQRVGSVGNNAVHPAHRRRGVGSRLHRAVLEEMREAGMRIAVVTTLLVDEPAQRMYRRHGFRELVRSIHYSQEL